ncbi:site-specific integrase [Streptomyces sp. H27-C3]|uniref:tyrosine-type recombinase/integrase n=1 Tax=Streptomyces sp. H27-C3 TaxID=3046305 RepID=UPI0024B9820F|nr:site-specific integrase [Streptomyces sp. H27-C3]MDJ0460435.1 site-specific integrase [Streptomyces sp. H27-C3]
MAYVTPRKNAVGEIASCQVKWRLGGSRSGAQPTERFDDEESAEVFRQAVDDNGQQWPPGWVKGKGYIDSTADTEERYVFQNYARESIKNRTAVEDHYRDAVGKELATYLLPTFGNCDVRSVEHFSRATVGAWVNQMAKTKVWRGSVRKEMSPKTLKNLHGLLSSILKEAVDEEPPLRARNPCDLTALPRTDDDGIGDDDEDMTFLTPQEVEAIVDELLRPEDKRFVRVAYATGFRWGEITALAKQHAVLDTSDGKYRVKVSRSWKRKPGEGFYLGKPKSKRSRRNIRVSASTWNDLLEHGLDKLKRGDLIFHNGHGERLPYSTFYDRWVTAVERAKKAGTLPGEKSPTIHDLRHSHAAALLSAGRGLTYVQRRLGHESITTTSDRYGHLLPEADDDAMETIEEALAGGRGRRPFPDGAVEVLSAGQDTRRLYVVHLLGHIEGFWKLDHAKVVAEQWEMDQGEEARVEAWSADWWMRSVVGGLNWVRHHVPDRVQVWSVGPALYAPDGTEHVIRPEDHEPRVRWAWEWEQSYTDEPACSRVEHREGPDGMTEAAAWGVGRAAVQAAYAQARTDALRTCAYHPSARTVDEGEVVN